MPKVEPRKLRYAVAGLGYFAQAAVLPAFAHTKGSELVALISDDSEKLDVLGAKYHVPLRIKYDELDTLLSSGRVDVVYVAVPNALHAQYAIAAARAGVHVLCEKPMAINEAECEAMIEAARAAGTKLMIAYRLHFEPANLAAIAAIERGEIGEARLFDSVFTLQVRDGNSRLRGSLGGGPLYDIGVYCINAARYLFRDEPVEVSACFGRRIGDRRFEEVDEQCACILRFPGDRLATFTASLGAAELSRYDVVGTEGRLRVEPAYQHAAALELSVVAGEHRTRRRFKRRDQVAPEILYFSRCIREDRAPEASGVEGLADVRIIRALIASAASGHAIEIAPIVKTERPDPRLGMNVSPHAMPQLVHAQAPTRS